MDCSSWIKDSLLKWEHSVQVLSWKILHTHGLEILIQDENSCLNKTSDIPCLGSDFKVDVYMCLSLFLWVAIIKYHRPGSHKKTKTYFTEFWTLEVQDQGTNIVAFSWWQTSSHFKAGTFSLFYCLVEGVGISLEPLLQGTNLTHEGSALMTEATPKGLTFSHQFLGIGLQHTNFGETQTLDQWQHDKGNWTTSSFINNYSHYP